MSEYELPYSFDLLFDIKTKLGLAAEYLAAKARLESLIETAKDEGIDLEELVRSLK